jgi:hypothetical protein
MSEQAQNNLIYIANARASFPWIVSPQVKKNEKGEDVSSYNIDLILPSTDPAFQKFMQVYGALAAEKWKENAQAAMQRIQMDRKTRCYGAGEEKVNTKTFQVHPGYDGNVFISARSSRQPQIIRADGTVVDPSNTMELRAVASKVYGGCYVNAVIKPWLQQNAQGIGVRCDLIAVQFAKDGKSFGVGSADVTGMFGQVADTQTAQQTAAPAMPAAPFPGIPSFM